MALPGAVWSLGMLVDNAMRAARTLWPCGNHSRKNAPESPVALCLGIEVLDLPKRPRLESIY